MSSSILFPAAGSRTGFRGDTAGLLFSGGRRQMPFQLKGQRIFVRASLDTDVSDMSVNGILSVSLFGFGWYGSCFNLGALGFG